MRDCRSRTMSAYQEEPQDAHITSTRPTPEDDEPACAARGLRAFRVDWPVGVLYREEVSLSSVPGGARAGERTRKLFSQDRAMPGEVFQGEVVVADSGAEEGDNNLLLRVHDGKLLPLHPYLKEEPGLVDENLGAGPCCSGGTTKVGKAKFGDWTKRQVQRLKGALGGGSGGDGEQEERDSSRCGHSCRARLSEPEVLELAGARAGPGVTTAVVGNVVTSAENLNSFGGGGAGRSPAQSAIETRPGAGVSGPPAASVEQFLPAVPSMAAAASSFPATLESSYRFSYPKCTVIATLKACVQSSCLLTCATYLQLRKAGFSLSSLHFREELARSATRYFRPLFGGIFATQIAICPMEQLHGRQSAWHDFLAVTTLVAGLIQSRVFLVDPAQLPGAAMLGLVSSGQVGAGARMGRRGVTISGVFRGAPAMGAITAGFLTTMIPAMGLGALSGMRKWIELKLDAYGEAEKELENFFDSTSSWITSSDFLVGKNFHNFMAFKKSKSNEFFFDCSRETIVGEICYYGMMQAFAVQFRYMGMKGLFAELMMGGAAGWEQVKLLALTEEVRPESWRRVETDFPVLAAKTLAEEFYWLHNHKNLFSPAGTTATKNDATSHRSFAHGGHTHLLQALSPTPASALLAATATTDRLDLEEVGNPSYQTFKVREARVKRFVVYATGTHSSLAQEPMSMLTEYVDLAGDVKLSPVYEVIDSTHCQFFADTQDCGTPSFSRTGPVGFQELSATHFASIWGNLLIEDYFAFEEEIVQRFEQHALREKTDVVLCSSPAVMCHVFANYIGTVGDKGRSNRNKKKTKTFGLLAYIGEPLLLAVPEKLRKWWFARFRALVEAGQTQQEAGGTSGGTQRSLFAVYNPFLKHMIKYQTRLDLPLIRVTGKYTGMSYTYRLPVGGRLGGVGDLEWSRYGRDPVDILVAKGPNICVDPICILKKISDKTRLREGRRSACVGRGGGSGEMLKGAQQDESDSRAGGKTVSAWCALEDETTALQQMDEILLLLAGEDAAPDGGSAGATGNKTKKKIDVREQGDVLSDNPVAYAVTEERRTTGMFGGPGTIDEDGSETPPSGESAVNGGAPPAVDALAVNRQYRFFGLDEFGPQHGSKRLTHSDMSSRFFAVVLYPYDVSLMLFYELYSAGVPLFLPARKLLHYYVFRGLHAYKSHHFVDEEVVGASPSTSSSRGDQDSLYPISPFFASLEAEQWYRGSEYWAKFTDFYQFPHIARFSTVAELLGLSVFSRVSPLMLAGLDGLQVGDGNRAGNAMFVSRQMRKMGDRIYARSCRQWGEAVQKVLLSAY
eukprot:g5473.t1